MGNRSVQRGDLVHPWFGIKNLLQVWEQAKDWEREQNYYENQKQSIYAVRCRYPMQIWTAIGVFVALSPNNSEVGNYRDLSAILDWWYNGDRIFKNPMPKLHTYGANVEKAKNILGGIDPNRVFNIKTAPKLHNFYHNTLDPLDPSYVTVDGHMVSVWQGRRLTMDQAGISRREYEVIKAGIQSAAQRVGLIPCQLQSTLWLTWRRIHKVLYDPQLKLDFTNPVAISH